MATQKTKKKTTKKKNTTGARTGILAIGIVLIICAFIFVSLLFFKKNQTENPKEPSTAEKGPVGDFEFEHEVEKIVIQSRSEEYHTNLVDITINLDKATQEEIEYVYISNTGFGQDEERYFADEQIVNWPIAETQDGQEHTVYITIVDKNGDIGRESATYKVDLR